MGARGIYTQVLFDDATLDVRSTGNLFGDLFSQGHYLTLVRLHRHSVCTGLYKIPAITIGNLFLLFCSSTLHSSVHIYPKIA